MCIRDRLLFKDKYVKYVDLPQDYDDATGGRFYVHEMQALREDLGRLAGSPVTDEALRAYRGTSVLGFDVVRSSYGFFPHFLIEVTEQDVEKKLEALSKYSTYADKYYFDPALLRATMVRHGALAEVPFAEGFDILRVVGKFEKCE